MERNKEYDEFGPWILEVEDESDVPAIFRNYYTWENEHLMLFKAPRKIERRKASPGMDLYDHLISAYDTYMHIYKRAGRKVDEKRIDYNNITALKDRHSLLDGELILFMEDEHYSINYNTVSEEIILKLINIIEKRINGGTRSITAESIPVKYMPEEDGAFDMHIYNLFNQLQKTNPEIQLIAYQSDINIKKTRELIQVLKTNNLKLSDTAFIKNGKELIVLERERKSRRKDVEGHVYSFLYLPVNKITSVALNGIYSEQGLSIMELRSSNHTFSIIFENTNNQINELYYELKEMIF